MKKLNKKQKIIALVAIILVAIILTLIITSNIVNNNKITSEEYLATTANAGSTLVANYIKKGVTIGGITGTLEVLDTSDATAKPEDIMWGKTGYVNGLKITGTRIETVAQAIEAQEYFTDNKRLRDDAGNTLTIPEGFKVSKESSLLVDGGIVIEDKNGNQFVWVPVGTVYKENGQSENIVLGRYTYDENGNENLVQSASNWRNTEAYIDNVYNAYIELESSSYGNTTAKDLGSFLTNTQNYGGFYIARFEAGDESVSDFRRENAVETNKPVSKKEQIPYTYITQPNAASLARNMYSSNSFESDLINSYAWDTTILFLQKFGDNPKYSISVGTSTTGVRDKTGKSILKSTNKLDVQCNIYDFCGNCDEWNTETGAKTSNSVTRGSSAQAVSSQTCFRGRNTEVQKYTHKTFRVILYIN